MWLSVCACVRVCVCGGRRTCGSACKVQVVANGDTDRKTRALQLATILRQGSSKAELTGAHAPPRVDVVLLCRLEVDDGRHTVRAQAEVVPQAADVPPLDGVQVVDARLDTVWQVVTAGARRHKFAHRATSHRGHSSMQCPGAAKGTFNAWRPHPQKRAEGCILKHMTECRASRGCIIAQGAVGAVPGALLSPLHRTTGGHPSPSKKW